MNKVVLNGKTLISANRAAQLSGYSHGYISQLCREKVLQSKQISGEWYCEEKGFTNFFKKEVAGTQDEIDVNNINYKDLQGSVSTKQNEPYAIKIGDARTGEFKCEGEDYISTQQASEMTGYAQDYIGQLSRNGEVTARKVGRRWFVSKESLQNHKMEKDAMLASMQAESAGVEYPDPQEESIRVIHNLPPKKIYNPNFKIEYQNDSGEPLIPNPVIYNSVEQEDFSDEIVLPLPVVPIVASKKFSQVKIYKKNNIPMDIENRLIQQHLGNRRMSYFKKSNQSNTEEKKHFLMSPLNFFLPFVKTVTAVVVAAFVLPAIFWSVSNLSIFTMNLSNNTASANLVDKSFFFRFLTGVQIRYGESIPGRTIEYISE